MTAQQFAQIPLAHIVPSPTNPRKTFHADRLAELAESIKASSPAQMNKAARMRLDGIKAGQFWTAQP